ncbi:MAG: protein kinase [Chloroflexales bacterium]|nr:protein kinase [Chloroflexales bacterium]
MKNLEQKDLGQNQLIEIIGRGSMSVVYKAFQPALQRYVAVKVLLQHLDPDFQTRFQREARAIASLQHPNILPIYDFAQQGDLSYFVLQYIEDGSTLGSLIASGALSTSATLHIAERLLDALDYAHQRGIIHRDIKPSNVLMPRSDWPLLADFGIARFVDESRQLTPAGQTVGTAAYMAPERATNAPADARADIYSLGVVLYEMVTGRVPFEATTPLAVLMNHVHQPLPPPRSRNAKLPVAVEQIIVRALEKNPDQRYQSAAEMRAAVHEALNQIKQERHSGYTTIELPPDDQPGDVPPSPLVWAPQSRTRLNTGFLVVLALLLLMGGVGVVWALGSGGAVGPAPAVAPSTAAPAGEATAVAAGQTTAPASEATIAPSAAAAKPTPIYQPTALPSGGSYVVQPGDTLSAIAERFGTTVEALLAANGLSDPNRIEVGQTLIVPGAVGEILPLGTSTTQPATPTQVVPATPAATVQAAPSPVANGLVAIRLEDSDWQGGYRRAGGLPYGGRTATWIYGSSTPYGTMRASLELRTSPKGQAALVIEGMDSEGAPKTPIRISINGVVIYEGNNPLPDDDLPLDSGTWASHSFSFDAALLRAGGNDVQIDNRAPGAFSLPPFFMLDYAEIRYSAS